jgi:hypothetical protein
MSKAKRNSTSAISPSRLLRIITLLWGPGRTPTGVVLLLAMFLIGWYWVWERVGGQAFATGRYAISQQQVAITPLPPWIHSDVRAEVFRNASLDAPLSVLDDQLTERIARGFALHPWIAKVVRVRKYAPVFVEVELQYRRPVCMVEVPGDLLPVDIEAVLLPSGDFSPIEKQSYPGLVGIDTRPMGPVGQRWGDGRVADGAEIAAALGPAWQQLRLYRIVPTARIGPLVGEPGTYELFTRAGTQVTWGRAPDAKTAGEIPAADKVARLLQYVADHGSLEGRQGSQRLDVRGLPPGRGK